MRVIALIFAIFFSLAFTACGKSETYMYSVEDSDGNVTLLEKTKPRTEPPTQAEKDLNYEKHLINRLQDAVEEYLEVVDEAVITVEKPDEIKQNITVAITTKSGEPLTDEEKEGIINLITNSFSSELPLNVSLVQRENLDKVNAD